MENRLELNKKPKYELPDNTHIVSYVNMKNRTRNIDFNYDVAITSMVNYIPSKNFDGKYAILIKTDNEDLINFILNYDFNSVRRNNNIGARKGLKSSEVKKIILEEFYKDKQKSD